MVELKLHGKWMQLEQVVQEIHGFAQTALANLGEKGSYGAGRADPKTLVKPDVWSPTPWMKSRHGLNGL